MSDYTNAVTAIKDLRSALQGARDLLGLLDPEMPDDYQELGAEIERALDQAEVEVERAKQLNEWYWVD